MPILVAGGGEKVTLRQVAQYADAANFGAGNTIGSAWSVADVRYIIVAGLSEANALRLFAEQVIPQFAAA